MADSVFLGEDPCPATTKSSPAASNPTATRTNPTTTPSTTTPSTTTPTTTSSTTPSTTSSSTRASSAFTSSMVVKASNRNQTLNGASHCHEYLVSGPRGVPDGQISASSQETLSNNAHRGRLYTDIFKYPNGYYLEGGWTADPSDTQPWIQIKMNWLTIVHGITTQGRHVNPDTGCCAEWTTQYLVRYSLDGQTWETVKDSNGNNKVFIGNADSDTTVTHMFDCPFVARFVRVEVLQFQGKASMRLDLIGCPTNAADLGTCPTGWTERPGADTCYYISDNTDLKTWEDGMLSCKRQQAEMVKIDSVQEKTWLQTELRALQQSQQLSDWWTGLNNRPRYDNLYYVWHDGSSLDTTVLQWSANEPDNAGNNEHCADYQLSSDNLSDKDCNTVLPYICERPKYWLKPFNTPGIVTLRPTVQATIAPATVKIPLPIPVGGTVVTSGPATFFTGCFKPSDCATRAWGDYPSCSRCGSYLTCAPNGEFIRNCPSNLKYDANQKACQLRSSTCTGP